MKKEEEGASCFVCGAVGRTLRAARWAGLAPLHFRPDTGGWRVSVSRGWTWYGYLAVTLIVCVTGGCLAVDARLPAARAVLMVSRAKSVVWALDAGCVLVVAGAAVLGARTHAAALITAFNDVEKINVELSSRRWPVYGEARAKRALYAWQLAVLLLAALNHALSVWTPTDDPVHNWVGRLYFGYYLACWILQLRETVFIMLTTHVLHCLIDINAQLRTLLRELSVGNELPLMNLFNSSFSKTVKKKTFKSSVSHVMAYSDMVATGEARASRRAAVRRLALAYARSCDVVQAVDAASGVIVLMMLGSFLLHLVCAPYYLINYMFRDPDVAESPVRHALHILCQLLWCVYHAVRLLMVIEPCHLTHMEMESTRELVSHLMRCPPSAYDPLAVELELFARHLQLSQAGYSAMQATGISRSLVATILGSITTYLVIILQLQ